VVPALGLGLLTTESSQHGGFVAACPVLPFLYFFKKIPVLKSMRKVVGKNEFTIKINECT